MQGGYDENVTGSGLSLIYPFTSPEVLFAVNPKLEFCNYPAFVESYKDIFPNYTSFVRTVFGEMWKALGDVWKLVEVEMNGKKYLGYETEANGYDNVTSFIYICSWGNPHMLTVYTDGTVTDGLITNPAYIPQYTIGNYDEIVSEVNLTVEEIYEKILESW